jgi:antirestriction protein ArdC
MRRDLYGEVSARIVSELERGAAPWVKPWSATESMNTPCNAVTNRPYSGCNVVLLWMARAANYRAPRFLTYKQALELGGHVRKGQRGTKVYFVKQLQVRDKDSDDESDLFRRAGDYVDKILRGAKPGDIPVEQPTRFDLVVNLTSAKAIGLTIPESFLLRADEVIE